MERSRSAYNHVCATSHEVLGRFVHSKDELISRVEDVKATAMSEMTRRTDDAVGKAKDMQQSCRTLADDTKKAAFDRVGEVRSNLSQRRATIERVVSVQVKEGLSKAETMLIAFLAMITVFLIKVLVAVGLKDKAGQLCDYAAMFVKEHQSVQHFIQVCGSFSFVSYAQKMITEVGKQVTTARQE